MSDDEPVTRPCPGKHPASSPQQGQPVWCLQCEARIRTAITGERGLAYLVAVAASRRDGQVLERMPRQLVSGRSAPAPATPSAGWEEVDNLARWAGRVAAEIAAQLGRRGDYSTALPDLGLSLRWIAEHLRPALTGPDAFQFGSSVLELYSRLLHLAGERPQVHLLRVTCPTCDQRAVVRDDGADLVFCRLCGGAWSEESFQAALEQRADALPARERISFRDRAISDERPRPRPVGGRA